MSAVPCTPVTGHGAGRKNQRPEWSQDRQLGVRRRPTATAASKTVRLSRRWTEGVRDYEFARQRSSPAAPETGDHCGYPGATSVWEDPQTPLVLKPQPSPEAPGLQPGAASRWPMALGRQKRHRRPPGSARDHVPGQSCASRQSARRSRARRQGEPVSEPADAPCERSRSWRRRAGRQSTRRYRYTCGIQAGIGQVSALAATYTGR